jgi:hypothetical protein
MQHFRSFAVSGVHSIAALHHIAQSKHRTPLLAPLLEGPRLAGKGTGVSGISLGAA